MKDVVLEPILGNDNAVLQFTERKVIDKHLCISVPSNYKAIGYINEKPCFRADPCKDTLVYKLVGKEYLKGQLKVCFILQNNLATMLWGFGNIEINNERLKEAYRIGANGKYSVKIVDANKLINAFSFADVITFDMIRDKTVSAIRNVGIALLSNYFANTNISVFEINSKIEELRDKLIKDIKKDDVFALLGVEITSLTIEGIHINEDDMAIIRNRLNKEEKKENV